MLTFQWNSLRVGDRVIVHDDELPGLPLQPGVVADIQTHRRCRDVAVRIVTPGVSHVCRPRRQAVHLAPLDPDDVCWRCIEAAKQRPTPSLTRCSRCRKDFTGPRDPGAASGWWLCDSCQAILIPSGRRPR
jgi:hypothetical protein